MQTYSLKYAGDTRSSITVGVSDAKMAAHVLEARECEQTVELWKGEHIMCSLVPCGEGLWLVTK